MVSIAWTKSGWTHLGALKSEAKAKNTENFESVWALLLLFFIPSATASFAAIIVVVVASHLVVSGFA
jgi:hypothetical protein